MSFRFLKNPVNVSCFHEGNINVLKGVYMCTRSNVEQALFRACVVRENLE